MKAIYIFLLIFTVLTEQANAQTVNSTYIKKLYLKYPTLETDFCSSCKLWVNPYYKSIADTVKHSPVLTYYIYTRAHRLEEEALNVPRSGAYAKWQPVNGQVDETDVYKEANRQIGKPSSAEMISKGHCQAWILLAWSVDGAILSNTYTFNAGMEYQGQNIGTQLATEELCRKLTGWKKAAVTDSIKIWCGTYGSRGSYTKNNITVSVPSHYYKILQYRDINLNKLIKLCYWMPNKPSEKKDKLPDRMISYNELVRKLGFDPQLIFY